MALFKKKTDVEYQEASQNLNTQPEKKAVDRIFFKEIHADSDVKDCGTRLKDGFPIVVNFGELDIDDANKNLAFLSGVTFCLEGEIIKIKEKVFLFAKKEDFLDGSLKNFLKEL